MRGEDSSTTTRRAVRYGSLPVLALAATAAVENGERLSLAQAVDGLKDAFDISDTAVGGLFAAMTAVGILGAFPFGILADRVRRTALLAVAMVVWTLCMGLNGLAVSFGMLFVARLGVGAVEANGPAAVSLLSDYYPVRTRAKMMGVYQSGYLVGALVGIVAGGFVVEAAGWRWAFWMWIPAGLLTALFVLRQPEPIRGDQDADFHDELSAIPTGPAAVDLAGPAALPEPTRVGTLDYHRATPWEVYRELLKIRSMWFGVLALTTSAFLLNGLQAWGVEYFKRAHDLDADQAGGLASVLLVGAAIGVPAGGFLADRLLRRGVLNARVYVVAASSIIASVLLVPAFLSDSLPVAAVLVAVGGAFLTLPVAPGEALVSDVVVAQLRGRAATMRSVVRSIAALSPLIIGALSDRWELSTALAAVTPLYAVGGILMLLAARTYLTDLSFAVAEASRLRQDARPDA